MTGTAPRGEVSDEQPLRNLGPLGSPQKRLDAASDMACAFRRDLAGSISRCVFIERSPAAFPVRRAANGWVNRLIALKDFSGCRRASVIDSGCDEGAASAHALGVKLRVAFGYARSSKRAHKPARRTTHDCPRRCTRSRRYKPARGHDRSNTRNC